MKAKITLLALVVVVGLGGLLVFRWRTSSKQAEAIADLRSKVEMLDQKERAAKAEAKQAEDEQRNLRGELRTAELEANKARAAAAAASQATNLSSSTKSTASSSPPTPGPGPGLLKQMMENPEMRKMIEAQQKVMVDMMYAPLLKQLNLSPEESDKLKSMLLEQQMGSVSKVGALMDPSKKEEQAAATKDIADQQKEFQDKIKEFLGEDRYNQYHDYTSTMGERMLLNQFAQTGNIKPEQNEALLQIMKEEKEAAAAINPDRAANDPSKGMKLLESDELAEQAFKQQEAINAKVLERARGILSEEQLQSFSGFQSNQVNMQRLGMKMARTMFQGGGATPPQQEPVAPTEPPPQK